jgi:hypothetical protein
MVPARGEGVLLGNGGVSAALAADDVATALTVLDSDTPMVDVMPRGRPAITVAVHGGNLTVGAIETALPPVVVITMTRV